ncbi:hypothetical protein [Streptomyces sp. MZ04]|uniref:hypothetical protein n=1 Tax=Streptomyces sp. MZ04 TaxID=2559236 RepID=UPI00107E7426|nr:hypothetical protein [Streptomyces sp. MZ04]TGB11571.1 hypothetical protein E2651_12890 [Streptomyces sp. MZ04]
MNEYNDWEAYVEEFVKDCADREATVHLRAGRAAADSSDDELVIAALPTIYRGIQFRSLLEACWSATLDSLGIAWEYEPQMFELPSGAKYLPDFHLTEIGVWLEVKGPGIPRVEKAYELGKMLACDCPIASCDCRWPGGEMVIVGHPPQPFDPWSDERYSHWPGRSKAKIARNHGGFIRWTSTRRHNSWLTRCSDCARTVWIEGHRVSRCPACGVRGESRLYRDFENHFEFVRLPWLSAANTQPDEGEAA